MPEVRVKTPATVVFVELFSESPLLLFKVSLLKMMALVPRIAWGADPLNTTVPVFRLKVPLLVRLPARLIVPALPLKVPPLLRFPEIVCV